MAKQFVNILSGQVELELSNNSKVKSHKRQSCSVRQVTTGCEACPLHKQRGIRKVLGLKRIKGKKIFVWAQAPGGTENDEGRELIGRAGNFFWQEAADVGIYRSMCDIQNVVRCWPTQLDEFERRKDRAPTKEEAKACSVYTKQALDLNGGAATLYLVLGQFAAPLVLGREYKKDKPVFWSEKLKANVICLDHPSYFLRGAPQYRLQRFRRFLSTAAQLVLSPGRHSYLKRQDYKTVSKPGTVKKLFRLLKSKALRGIRITVDIEEGRVNLKTRKADPHGERAILCIGFSGASGHSRTVLLDHPGNSASQQEVAKVKKLVVRFMEDPDIAKVMHYGCSDSNALYDLLHCKVKNFHFDTNYATYFRWPDQKKYGLDECTRQRLPEFAGYKDIIKPYLDPADPNFATIPISVLRLYNGGDTDVTKRLERMTAKHISLPLLSTYVDASFVLYEMQNRGPLFDFKYYKKAATLVKTKLRNVTNRLLEIADNPDFNPNAPQQVSEVLYDKLGLPEVEGRTTRAEVLDLLGQRKNGEFARKVKSYRELSKMDGTYLANYLESAKLNEGELRTIWWLTGTVTGRLRSGGGDDPGIVNMQNLHGDPLLLNLLISDFHWRRLYSLFQKGVYVTAEALKKAWSWIKKLRAFLAYDYGQIEIRILAHMSGDKKLLEAVESGDIHSAVGHELTGWSIDDIKNNKDIRVMIKNLHFGIVYGMSKPSLFVSLRAKGVKISRSESDELHDKYFAKYAGVRAFVNDIRNFAERHGYVETIFGFQRPIYVRDEDSDRESFWGNQAINSPIQGSAHQLLLIALAILRTMKKTYSTLQEPVLEIHDALVFFDALEVLKEGQHQGLELLTKEVPRYIERVFKFSLKVPLVAEAKVGFRLGSMTEYEGGSVLQFVRKWVKSDCEVEKKIDTAWRKAA